jgi:hypothetical protein
MTRRHYYQYRSTSLDANPKKHRCYDTDVEVDDPIRDSMREFVSLQNIDELEESS